jgi:hypothetical protein
MWARSGSLATLERGSARPSRSWGGAGSDGGGPSGCQVVVKERQVRFVVNGIGRRACILIEQQLASVGGAWARLKPRAQSLSARPDCFVVRGSVPAIHWAQYRYSLVLRHRQGGQLFAMALHFGISGQARFLSLATHRWPSCLAPGCE